MSLKTLGKNERTFTYIILYHVHDLRMKIIYLTGSYKIMRIPKQYLSIKYE